MNTERQNQDKLDRADRKLCQDVYAKLAAFEAPSTTADAMPVSAHSLASHNFLYERRPLP